MALTGYSGTPLAKKLGIKEGSIVRLVNQPHYYFDLFTDLPDNIIIQKDTTTTKHLVHYFTKDIAELERDIEALRQEIFPNGMVWISWPKKASKIPTNITEDSIRQLALASGLVDVKVCAIDDIWSGLKLVVRVKDRVVK
jgi:proteasome assembly chaperone (PAC2) family protein